ncbi:unnamed protein product [Rhodiola kirilowii]
MIRLLRKAMDLKYLLIPNRAQCIMGILNNTYTTTSSVGFVNYHDFVSGRHCEAGNSISKVMKDAIACTKMIKEFLQSYRLNDALHLFAEMPHKDAVSWNLTIKGCLDCGELDMAVRLYNDMPEKNIVSRTTMLNGYLQLGRLEMAEQLFHEIPHKDTAAWNSMINGYFNNGRVEEGVRLFERMPIRDVISWTSVISGLERHGRNQEALECFKKMMGSHFHHVKPTSSTFCSVLKASASSDVWFGFQVHACLFKLGHASDSYASASLITFYATSKEMEYAHRAFDESLDKNVVICTALLTGYGLNSEHENALKVFCSMMKMGVLPNQSSFTSALNSCCELESHDKGRIVHSAAIKLGFETDAFIGNSLVVMYSKCGHFSSSVYAFEGIKAKNLVSWNSIIVGCAQHGFGMWTLIYFSRMIRAKVKPDEITFTGLLSACSHSGMIHKGRLVFKYFSLLESVTVTLEHFSLMVTILARCGNLGEAEEFIANMPLEPNAAVWLALLSACSAQSNIEVAERAANHIFELHPHYSATYTLLSNLYASANRWPDVSRIRSLMKHKGIVKQPGCSWVVHKGTKHMFISGDKSHPLTDQIYHKLNSLHLKLREMGYQPDSKYALHDVELEQKETMLNFHSERLAIAFALLCSSEGSAIIVMKNLRICGDCHFAVKLIAKVVNREIVVRDCSRFHHFRDGFCSCGDYW